MAKRYVVVLTNGVTSIFNGWCDPKLGAHFDLLPPYAQQEYLKCTGQTTSTGTKTVSSTKGGQSTLQKGTSASQVPNNLSSSGSRAGLLGGSGAANPAAPEAVDLNVPQLGPGGRGFRLGPSEIRYVLPHRDNMFTGVDSQAAETKLGDGKSPYSINWDSFRVPGSLCVRSGMIKMSEDVDTLSPTNTNGLGIVAIPPIDPSSDKPCMALLAFGDAAFSTAPSSGNVSWSVASLSPQGRDIVDVRNRPGPSISLTGGVGTLDITVEGWTGNDHYHLESDSIAAVTVAYSAENYPSDPEASRSDRAGVVPSSGDRVQWDGATDKALTQVTGLAAGTYYVSAWAWTHSGGRTRRTIGKVTVS